MKIGFAVLILAATCLAGCGIDYPVTLSIHGIPARPLEASITGMQVRDGGLILQLKGSHGTFDVHISPWPLHRLPEDSADSIRSHSRYSPAGPSYVIELLQQGETVLFAGDNTAGTLQPLPEWRATAGREGGPDRSGERLWVDLVLQRGSTSVAVESGKPVVIESRGQKWFFLLLGASVPNPAADRQGVAAEQRKLSIDWLLYR